MVDKIDCGQRVYLRPLQNGERPDLKGKGHNFVACDGEGSIVVFGPTISSVATYIAQNTVLQIVERH